MDIAKKVLIISPYFPPSNAADVHRIRMSLPYFSEFGWNAEVVTVDPVHSVIIKDPLLEESINKADVKVHYVNAFSRKWTSKLGLGSIALRSLWFYWVTVNRILKIQKFDLIYFSTTQFPVCILGSFWKKKFGIPYVIDMQDPWHSSYYKGKPKHQRPKKYWFSYYLNKFLEPIAMQNVDGIISVSKSYIETLRNRYKRISAVPCKVITFGYFEEDFRIARENSNKISTVVNMESGRVNVVYIGRGGFDMQQTIYLVFTAFKELLVTSPEEAEKIRLHFIGTSYAAQGTGLATFSPVATQLGISQYVQESTDRVTFYEAIKALQNADGVIIPGSDDAAYTASKIYPYILAQKPLLGIFQSSSSAYHIINDCQAGKVADLTNKDQAIITIKDYFVNLGQQQTVNTNWKEFEKYSAKNMTAEQCYLFNKII